MCEQCNELKQRIVELERVVIALTSNAEANELQKLCTELLERMEFEDHKHDGCDVEFERDEL